MTAIIQIQYSGPSENFAWLLPVQGDPTVEVSSNAAFDRLQAATNPSYQLTTIIEGTCNDDFGSRAPSATGVAENDDLNSAPQDAGTVTVVNEGSVGPYDYVVISIDETVTDHAEVALEWLENNSYDVTDFGLDVLRPYLEADMNLLAFRLTKGNDAGSIRPVSITFGQGLPSIPIRPTAVAATADMGVMVWVLGEQRAIPANYMSLELNEALVNWLNPNSNYNDVVTLAANEAGGQGFVTEMAGDAAPLADTIFQPWEQSTWETRASGNWIGREGELLLYSIWDYSSLDGMRDVVSETVPLPSGTTVDDLLSCPSCYFSGAESDIAGFEVMEFLSAVLTQVIEPMERTREMFEEHAKVTRLYTTMSADEMTRDPIFDFNGDLGDSSNVHTAERIIECSDSVSQSEAPWRIELPSGDIVRGEGTAWPFDAAEGDLPANRRVLRVGTSGEGTVEVDNVSSISSALAEHNATVPSPGACATSTGRGGPAGLAIIMIAVGLLGLRRRTG